MTQAGEKIADAHAHIFPHKIADKAVAAIGSFYDIPMEHQGFAHSLLESGGKIGVDKYLVCSTATHPGQVVSINNFIDEKCRMHPEFLGFATLHPDFPDLEAEVERIVSLGLHGIKLHPDFQRFDIDDPRALPMYRLAAEAGLPVLFHTGDDRYDFSAPRRLRRVLDQVPGLTCIAAHFGGYRRWGEALEYLRHPGVWFDTSSSLFAIEPDQAMEMMDRLGFDRFLFGSDFPMWDHQEELARFDRLPLTPVQRRQILSGNFCRLFGVEF